MPFDAGGNFSRSYNFEQDRINGIKIMSARVDGEFDNYAAGLNQTFLRTGAVPMSGALRMGGYGISGLGDGSLATPAWGFSSEANTGMFRSAPGELAMSGAGVNIGRFNATGAYLPGLLSVTGAATVGGTLGVTGATTLNSTLSVTGNTTIGGTLGVTGAMTANGLTLTGQLNTAANISTGNGVSTGDVVLEVGGLRTGAGNAYIDLHAQSGTDFESRLIRNGGANGILSLQNNGTGDLQIMQNNAGAITFGISGAEKGKLGTDGRWQLGSAYGATGGAFLNISDGAADGSNYGRGVQIVSASGNRQQMAFIRAGNNVISMGYLGPTAFWGLGTGNTTDSSWVPDKIAIDITNNFIGFGGVTAPISRVDAGNGTVNGGNFQINGSSSAASGTVGFLNGNGPGIAFWGSSTANPGIMTFNTAGTEKARVDASGNFGIGTTNPAGYRMRVVGSSGTPQFRAGTDATAYWEINGFDAGTIYLVAAGSTANLAAVGSQSNIPLALIVGNSEKARLDTGGNFMVNTGSNVEKMNVGGLIMSILSGRAGFRLYNGGAVTEWFTGQKASNDHDYTWSSVVAGVYTDLMRLNNNGDLSDRNGNQYGYKGLPQASQAGSFTFALTDAGKHTFVNIAGAYTATVPPNSAVAFPIGTVLTLVNYGTTAATLAQGAGVTLRLSGTSTTGNRTVGIGAVCTALKVSTDIWMVSGAGVS